MNLKNVAIGVLVVVLASIPGLAFAGAAEFKMTSGGFAYTFPVSMESRWDTLYFRPVSMSPVMKTNSAGASTVLQPFTRMVYQKGADWFEVVQENEGLSQYPIVVTTGSFSSDPGLGNLPGDLQLTELTSLAATLSYGAWNGALHGAVPPYTTSDKEIAVPLSSGATFYLLAENRSQAENIKALRVTLGKRFSFEEALVDYYQNLSLPPALPASESNEFRALVLAYFLYSHLSSTGSTPANQSTFLNSLFPSSSGVVVSQLSGAFATLVSRLSSDAANQKKVLRPLSEYLGAISFAFKGGSRINRFPGQVDLKPAGGVFYATLAEKMNGSTSSHHINSDASKKIANIAYRFLVGVNRSTLSPSPVQSTVFEDYVNWIRTGTSQYQSGNVLSSYMYPNGLLSIPTEGSVATNPALASQISLRFVENRVNASNAYFVASPFPNLLNEATLSNHSAVKVYTDQSPRTSVQAVTSFTLEFQFKEKQNLGSLLLWTSPDFALESVQGDGVTVFGSSSQWRRAQSSSQWGLVPYTGNTGVGSPQTILKTIELRATGIQKLTVKFSGKLYKVRAYEKSVAVPIKSYAWRDSEANSIQIDLKGASGRVDDVAVFPEGWGSDRDIYFFLERTSLTLPGVNNQLTESLPINPITYSAYGLESPRSHSLKVLANLEFPSNLLKGGRSAVSNFPITELDLKSVSKTVTEQFLYADGLNPPYSSYPASTPYPYTFGIHLPTTGHVVTNPASPFYAEKITGVDSFGLLLSILKLGSLDGLSPVPSSQELASSLDASWTARNNLLTLPPSVSDPFAAKPSDGYYRWRNQAGNLENWLHENSVTLGNGESPRPGDILVGQEGTQTEVAIIVNGPTASGYFHVVTINAALGRAVLGAWSPIMQSSLFTIHANQYHVRRLLTSKPAFSSDWVKKPYVGSPVYQTTAQTRGNNYWWPWIGNTKEPHYIGQVSILSTASILDGTDWDLRAQDYAYDKAPSSGLTYNLYKNFGPLNPTPEVTDNATTFYLVASEPYVELAERGLDVVIAETGTTLNPAWNLHYASNPGTPISALVVAKIAATGQKDLGITRDSRYRYKVIDQKLTVHFDGKTYSEFSIVAVGTGGAPPNVGDDLQLAFAFNGGTTEYTQRWSIYDSAKLFSSANSEGEWAAMLPNSQQTNREDTQNLFDLLLWTNNADYLVKRYSKDPVFTNLIDAEYRAKRALINTAAIGYDPAYDGIAFALSLSKYGSPVALVMLAVKDPSSLSSPEGVIDLVLASSGFYSAKSLKAFKQFQGDQRLPNGKTGLRAVRLFPEYISKRLGYPTPDDAPAVIRPDNVDESTLAQYYAVFEKNVPENQIETYTTEELYGRVAKSFDDLGQSDTAEVFRVAGKVAINVASATEKQLDDIYLTLRSNPPYKYTANTIEHKADRWAQYKARMGGNAIEYSSWSNVYNSNMINAVRANKVADEVMSSFGWGIREVTVPANGYNRRLDIADASTRRGVEVKSYETGKVYVSEGIRTEIAADKFLVENEWDIEWVFVKCDPSGPLGQMLKDAGIKVTRIP